MDYRQQSLETLAAQRGYPFSATDAFGLHRQLEDFRLAARGRQRTVTNILHRQQGLTDHQAHVFDYAYRAYGDKRRVNQTVLFLQSKQIALPELSMQPESLLHKLGELFGFQDIDFVRYPKFSGQYRLTGDDVDYIRHHFNDEVLNYFTLHRGWSLEGIGYYLIFYKQGLLLPPGEIEDLYHRGVEVLRLLSTPA